MAEEFDADKDLVHLRVDPAIYQAILLHRIDKKLGLIGQEMSSVNDRIAAKEARGMAFPPDAVYQRKTIPAGESAKIYEYETGNNVAFVYHVGCQYYANVQYRWYMDGVLKENIERTIGNPNSPMSEPLQLVKPYIAEKRIIWRGINKSDSDHVFEVLCDGILYPKGIANLLGGAEL